MTCFVIALLVALASGHRIAGWVDFDPVAVGIDHGHLWSDRVVVDPIAVGAQPVGERRQIFGGFERESTGVARDRVVVSRVQTDRTGRLVRAQRSPALPALVPDE